MNETDLTRILKQKFPQAIEFSLHIIFQAKGFLDFAVSLADYMGEDFIPYCKPIYALLRCLPHMAVIQFEDETGLRSFSNDRILAEYKAFKQKQADGQRQKEFKENIDELQFLVKNYRKTEEFKKLLDFVGRFKYLAPYNAILAQMQKPGAEFVLTGKKWEEYGRQPKPNAQKIIILKPFGPIQCAFDYGDTQLIPGIEYVYNDVQILEEIDKTLSKAKGNLPEEMLETLCYNLSLYGIYLEESFRAANAYGGYIMPYKNETLRIKVSRDTWIKTRSRFIISVNHKQESAVKFHTICHELGHLFCFHQHYNPEKRRTGLSLKECEFEAETVAWLVCKRQGIHNPSEEYLATYTSKNDEIPICSTDLIMKAVTEIEKMLSRKLNIKESLWYQEDKDLKHEVSKVLNMRRTDLFDNMY